MNTYNTQFFKRTALATAIGLATFSLTGCMDSSDGDKPSATNLQMSGAVVDAFVANSRVWLDENGNKQRDNDEPWAYTDAQGYYSYRPARDGGDAINYCVNPRDTANYRYCLEIPDDAGTKNHQVCTDGGRDQLTGKLYRGLMCMPVTTQAIAEAMNADVSQQKTAFVNPLTTLIEKLEDATLLSLYQWAYDTNVSASNDTIKHTFLRTNTFELTNDSNTVVNENVFKFAFQAHKLAETMAAPLASEYNLFKPDSDQRMETSTLVPKAFEVIADYLDGEFSFKWETKTNDPLTANDIGTNLAQEFLNAVNPAEYSDINTTAFTSALSELKNNGNETFKANIDALNQVLNDTLAVSTVPAEEPAAKTRRLIAQAFAGEVVTETVIQSTERETTTSSRTNLSQPATDGGQTRLQSLKDTASTIKTEARKEPEAGKQSTTQSVDFKQLTTQVTTATSTATSVNQGAINALSNNPSIPFSNAGTAVQYIAVADADTDKRVYLFFGNANATNPRGTMHYCGIDGAKDVEFISGTYEVDKDKKFILYMNALGQSIAVKNLWSGDTEGSNQTACNNDNETRIFKSCVAVESRNIDTGRMETDYFGNTELSSNNVVKNFDRNDTINSSFCNLLKSNKNILPISVAAD
jgi:hypothetical protein